jgi:hypothetical protein
MSDGRIKIEITAIDNASSIIAGASDKIASALKNVAVVQNDFSRAVSNSVAPLTDAEQAQLDGAASALQLKDAEGQVQAKQENLNTVIRTYGVDSKEAAAALRDLKAAQDGLAASQSQVTATTQKASISYKDLTISAAGAATAGFALYNAYDNVADMSVQVSKANLQVKSTANSAQDAQEKYNDAVNKYGANSEEATKAAADLAIAQERAGVAVERADMIQGNYNETIARSAISVLPSVITMVASLSSIKTILTGTTIAETAATATSGAAHAAAIGPTVGLTGAMGLLNAVMAINPIILVVMAIAALVIALIAAYNYCKPFKDAIDAIGGAIMNALKPAIDVIVGALTWLWNNVLVPLGEFIYNVFIKHIEAAGAAIKWFADGIGAIAGWLGDAWAKLTGTFTSHVERGMKDQLRIVEDGLKKQTDEVNKKYDEMVKTVDSAYKEETDAAIASWEKRLNQEVTGWDKVLKIANDNSDKLVDAVKSKLDDQTGVIEDSYSDQLDRMKSSYDKQVDETNRFYDEIIDTTESKLEGVQSAREDDLNSLELSYLVQKQVIEDNIISKKTTVAMGQIALETLETNYNRKRSGITEGYRVEELKAEIANKSNTLQAEADRTSTLERLKTTETTSEVALLKEKTTKIAIVEREATLEIKKINEERNITIKLITEDRDRIENKHTADLKDIYTKRESELNVIVQKAADERLKITQIANDRIAEENKRLGIAPSPAIPLTMPGVLYPRARGEGGLVSSPEIALVGEAGPELIIPVGKLESAIANMVPRFAEGGLVTQSTLAVIGEAGPEVVAPLSMIGRTISEISEVSRSEGETSEYSSLSRIGRIVSEIFNIVPKFAEGGVVTEPTFALIGESGPEAVVPLDKFGSRESGNVQYNTIYVTIPIGNVTAEVPLDELKETVISGVVEGIRRRG